MKISVITVCYNSEKTIRDTLRSFCQQKYPNREHIIIDGLSTDNTLNIVKEEVFKNHRQVSERDRGIYEAMNKGFLLASGEVIGFLNSDDYYPDDNVLCRVAQAFKNPEIEGCFGDLIYVTCMKDKVVRYWKSNEFKKGSFAFAWSPAHPTFFIRRSALGRLGLFDLSYKLAADAEFMMRYLEFGSIKSVYIPNVQVCMRIGGVSNNSWINTINQNKEIFHALEKNNISYNLSVFWSYKLINRLKQRLAGLMY